MSQYKIAIAGGCGSSGTTLLAHLLSKHPDVGSGPEFNCFNHYELFDFPLFRKRFEKMFAGKCEPWGYVDIHVFMTYREQYGIDYPTVKNWIENSKTTNDFFQKLYEHMYKQFNTDVFLEKSPTNVYSFKILSEQYREIPLIHLVRDGRDVAASLMKRGFNLYFAGSRWLYDTLCGMAARPAKTYLELTYEDLVQNPDKVLGEIFRHIGVDPDNYGKQVEDAAGASRGIYQENWKNRKEPQVWNQTPADPVSTASIGRYKKAFSDKDLSTLYRIKLTQTAKNKLNTDITTFGDLIDYLGYGPTDQNPTHVGVSRKIEEKNLELQDFFRRLQRYKNNRKFAIPGRYTRIA